MTTRFAALAVELDRSRARSDSNGVGDREVGDARLHDRQMGQLRSAALAAGLPITEDEDVSFFRGRIPA